jgi:hypothetical protein
VRPPRWRRRRAHDDPDPTPTAERARRACELLFHAFPPEQRGAAVRDFMAELREIYQAHGVPLPMWLAHDA